MTIESVPLQVAALVEDLFFLVQIKDAARRAGCEIVFVKSAGQLTKRTNLLIVDLNAAALEPIAIIEAAKTLGIRVLAFVPHVNAALKQQALDAGADTVVARSNFAPRLKEALENLTATR